MLAHQVRAAVALCLASLAGAALVADAQVNLSDASRPERRVALVLGNARYAPPATLPNPVNDARDMAQALRTAGFDVVLETDADLKAMQRAVRDFGSRLRPDGAALFYYAGHGVQVKGSNYLVPLAAKILSEAEVEDEALDANRVLKVMEESRSRVNIVVLDACRDNPFSRGTRSLTRGLALMPAPSGTLIAYATGPGAVAADGTGRNGLFTGELLRAMRVPGVDIIDVFRNVIGAVRQQTGGRQVPWVHSSLDSYFYFRPATPSPPTARAVDPPTPKPVDPPPPKPADAPISKRAEPPTSTAKVVDPPTPKPATPPVLPQPRAPDRDWLVGVWSGAHSNSAIDHDTTEFRFSRTANDTITWKMTRRWVGRGGGSPEYAEAEGHVASVRDAEASLVGKYTWGSRLASRDREIRYTFYRDLSGSINGSVLGASGAFINVGLTKVK